MDEYNYTDSTNEEYSYTSAPAENFNYDTTSTAPVRYPGKEIAVLILGINSLVWAALSIFCVWIPFYGLIFLAVWGGISLACTIVCNKYYKTVTTFATETTSKLHTGKKLAKIGTILLIVDAAICVISCLISILVIVFAAMSY